jgi:hypothetical protein
MLRTSKLISDYGGDVIAMLRLQFAAHIDLAA